MDALARALPKLAARIPRVALGDWPTPLARLPIGDIWIKNEGASSATYGGNKVRTLEVWLGHARDRGASRLWTIGAYGSNHAIATILHARRAGLEAGAIVFPQPSSEWAIENCGAILDSGCPLIRLRSVVEVPFAQLLVGRQPGALVMPPGGATTLGAFGAASAAFELAEQIAAGLAPPPRRIVLAGNAPPDDSLHRAVEAWGGSVVLELTASASESHADSAGDLDAIADQLQARATPVQAMRRDANWVVNRAHGARADAVVLWLIEEDEALPWEIARQMRSLRDAGMPALLLARQPWAVSEGALRQVKDFMTGSKVDR